MNLTKKILQSHLVSGDISAVGNEISIKICQTLTQDSTGTMAYLQFEALNADKVRTELSVAYIDHNTLQSGYENADDHAYIQSIALKKGIVVSKPGNGICHQVHLERFGIPSKTLIGSDSHTPTAGGLGMLAIGAGGLDVAVAMGGGAYYLNMPEVIEVRLTGRLQNNASAKDVILELLRKLTVKGGVNKIFEYTGDGVTSLSVPERATITNMGAELGATTSIFPSDEVTRKFLVAQGRGKDFIAIAADDNAKYDQTITIELGTLVPLIAKPHSPDNVVPVSELAGTQVNQVCIGSCTNSSLLDMLKVAAILKGKRVHPNVSLTISPGSRQVLAMLANTQALKHMLDAGARVLECACGPCIGMGQSPKTNGISLRTFNRNFYARSGTNSAEVYLCSPETAAYSALEGVIVDPHLYAVNTIILPEKFDINDNLIVTPDEFENISIERGPNIKPFPHTSPLENTVQGQVLLNADNNVTTDDIMPSNSKLLPFRSNIPHLANFCFNPIDPDFAKRALAAKGGFIVAGDNYGQGSSREHAALVPLYLGVKAVIATSFARIHKDNLINNGILPLTFVNAGDKAQISLNDDLCITDAVQQVKSGKQIIIINKTNNTQFLVDLTVTDRQRDILVKGGVLSMSND